MWIFILHKRTKEFQSISASHFRNELQIQFTIEIARDCKC